MGEYACGENDSALPLLDLLLLNYENALACIAIEGGLQLFDLTEII